MCLLDDMKLFFESNERQFGFKKNVGCRDAIFALKSVVNYYTSNGSTVSICSIDITRAFDCVSHNKLWEIMSNLGFPSYIINILSDWYDKIWFTVKWGCEFSAFNKLATGVKQGGILSPFLFSIYINPVLNSLTLSGLGCRIDGWCCNSFMYADDLILLAISNNNLIKLIKKCQSEFNLIGLEINANKSGAMKFGSRHSNQLNPLVVDNLKISWVKELVYLGVRLSSSNKFNVNPQSTKQKFYSSCNGVFGKVGTKCAPNLLVSLMNTFCYSILLYASEAINMSSKLLKGYQKAYNCVFSKVFCTYDVSVIQSCQYYMSVLPFEYRLDLNKLNFMSCILHNTQTSTFIKK